jgi:hypothetical protein
MSKTPSSPWHKPADEDMIPHWWRNLTKYADECGTKYYKVNYIQTGAYHNGPCLWEDGYESDNIEWRKTNSIGYIPFDKWDFDVKDFRVDGELCCILGDMSGYYGLWSRIKLQSVELITNETPS